MAVTNEQLFSQLTKLKAEMRTMFSRIEDLDDSVILIGKHLEIGEFLE